MQNLDMKNYLYHGIVDWLNYNNSKSRDSFCLDKLNSILKHRYIYRPCDFKKYGISHNDCANPYTYYFTFVGCHPDSLYADRFKKNIKDDNGYIVATRYSKFGVLLSERLLSELTINEDTFCDKEVLIEDNISIDEYGIGIYINPITIDENSYQTIGHLIKKYNYIFGIIDLFDGTIVQSLEEEKQKCKKIIKL